MACPFTNSVMDSFQLLTSKCQITDIGVERGHLRVAGRYRPVVDPAEASRRIADSTMIPLSLPVSPPIPTISPQSTVTDRPGIMWTGPRGSKIEYGGSWPRELYR